MRVDQEGSRLPGSHDLESGIDQEKAKTEAIVSWGTPTTKKELQRFLGLANYYRKFVKDYATIAVRGRMQTLETPHIGATGDGEIGSQLAATFLRPAYAVAEANEVDGRIGGIRFSDRVRQG